VLRTFPPLALCKNFSICFARQIRKKLRRSVISFRARVRGYAAATIAQSQHFRLILSYDRTVSKAELPWPQNFSTITSSSKAKENEDVGIFIAFPA
jgi:hypothetical protein